MLYLLEQRSRIEQSGSLTGLVCVLRHAMSHQKLYSTTTCSLVEGHAVLHCL